jgi:hypothetical protein
MGGVVDQALGAVSGGLINTDFGGTKGAMNAQGRETNNANAELAPWKTAGLDALKKLQDGFSMEKDAGYQFRLDEGNKAINAAANAAGRYNSGGTLKELTQYGQNFASNEYDKAYNRFQGNQGALANYGFNAAQGIGANQIGFGNASAAASMAGGKQLSDAVGSGIGMLAAFSDARLKTNIQSVSELDLIEMKKNLKALSFGYIDNKFGDGEWVGVMAQDLIKSKLGRTLVFKDENGLYQLHLPKILSLFLATMAEG